MVELHTTHGIVDLLAVVRVDLPNVRLVHVLANLQRRQPMPVLELLPQGSQNHMYQLDGVPLHGPHAVGLVSEELAMPVMLFGMQTAVGAPHGGSIGYPL